MSHVAENVVVDCPASEATTYVIGFLEELGARDDEGAVLAPSVPVGDAKIDREVVAKLTSSKVTPGLTVMGFSWRPKGGGPYPTFEGNLTLTELTALTSQLTLSGEYGPPGGLAGAAFDAILGHRLASASLRALLATLKSAIETARQESAVVAATYLPTYE